MSRYRACKNCVFENPEDLEEIEKVKKYNPKLITERDKENLKRRRHERINQILEFIIKPTCVASVITVVIGVVQHNISIMVISDGVLLFLLLLKICKEVWNSRF